MKHITATILRLEQIRLHAYHGVLPQERQTGGMYTVSVTLHLANAEKAIEEDDLDGTVNYAEVLTLVQQVMQEPVKLIEHAAGKLLDAIFAQHTQVKEAAVSIRKDTPPMGGLLAGASIELRAVNPTMLKEKKQSQDKKNE